LEFTPPTSALAVTITTYDSGSGKIVDTDIYFNNDNFKWGHIDSEEEEDSNIIVDIQNIATHEIGHFFGFDHASESPMEGKHEFRSATMYYSSGAGDVSRRTLNDDDTFAVKHLYPTDDYNKRILKPVASSITTDHGFNNGSEISVIVKGQNFGPLTMIKLVGPTRNDTVCKILSITSQTAECAFDLYNTNKGEYSLSVANSYNKGSILANAFTVYGREIEQPSSGGGCGNMDGSNHGISISLLGMIILVFPITLVFLRKRVLVLAKVQRNRRR